MRLLNLTILAAILSLLAACSGTAPSAASGGSAAGSQAASTDSPSLAAAGTGAAASANAATIASATSRSPASVSTGAGAPASSASASTASPASASAPAAQTSASAAGGAPLTVVAAENFWGSIGSQLGGDRVRVISVIVNPAADPHDYEPTPADARLVASARYVIVNGAGYDPWAEKLLAANPVAGRRVLNVGDLVGKKAGDNPHLWYNPAYVEQAIARITSDLQALDPADAAYFDQQRTQFETVALKPYHDHLAAIKRQFAGAPVGATESIFVYMADALGLKLLTPPAFMQAISEGSEPAALDKATADQQIKQKQIAVLLYNKQNATPDTDALKQEAQAAGIPVVAITETLEPAGATFQEWQDAQLQALLQALAKSTGR